jgi:Zn finger protein HypA/HybF involved in hydrogenase expression
VHELSLAVEICRMAEAHLGATGAGRLRCVALEVGDDAGVEADNLEFCLGALLAQAPFAGARATITRMAGSDLRVSYLEVDDGDPDD